MSRKLFFVLLMFILLSSLLYVGLNPVVESTNSYLVWNQNTGLGYATIQEAINANETLDGHTIFVEAGTYYELVVVNKSLSLVGENRDTTIIDGGRRGTVITVIANNVVINGFTVQNSTPYLYGGGIIIHNSSNSYVHGNKVSYNLYGILLELNTNCSVYDNIVTNNDIGIGLFSSSNCSVYGNGVISNWEGIMLDDSSNCHVYGNTGTNNRLFISVDSSSNLYIHDNNAKGNSRGIILGDSSNCTLRNNNMTNNSYNRGVHGDSLRAFIHDIDASNIINGKRVRYLINQKNLTINLSTYPDTGYLAVVNSTLITVEDLTLTGNKQGVLLAYVTNSVIKNITATNNYYGIQLSHSSNFFVFDNTLTKNGEGISLDYCSNGSLYTNTLTKNGIGISLWHSSNISVYDNKAMDNGGSCMNCGGIRLSHSSNCFVYNNDLIRNNDGIYLEKSSNNHIYGNNINNNKYRGIESWQGRNNTIFHNNFVGNGLHAWVYPPLVNFWDNGFEGNYWNNYGELDTDGDGIGDTPYVIDVDNQDRYPLVVPRGPIPIVWGEMIYPVELDSNSTISRFRFKASQKMISFNVTGPDGTPGFCNLTIPNSLVQDLWQGDFTVLVDGEEPLTMNNWTDGTYTYIYFTYQHSTHKVEIIPEFPTWTSILLIVIVLTVAIALTKRRLLKTPIH